MSVLLRKLTRREFRQRMNSGELKACIIPLGAIEQHLEHLEMEHDWRSVNLVADAVASRCSPHVLVAQGLMVGVSEHHMNHPGTLTLRPGTFLCVLNDLIRSVTKAGFQNVLVLNGHGGNVVPCQSAWDQFVREFKINLRFLSYWDVLDESDAQLLRSGQRLPEDLPGHAQEFETAIAWARFPENIRTEAMAEQSDKTPAHANAELGEEFLKRIVDRIADYVAELMEQEVEIPPFHP